MKAVDDIMTYLEADASLDTLLGATGSDSKIYPIEAPQSKATPFIVVTLIADGTPQEILNEFTVEMKVVNTVVSVIQNICKRLDQLLDLQDNIQGKITSPDFIFKWCKKSSGRQMKDPDTGEYYRALTYDFKVHRLY